MLRKLLLILTAALALVGCSGVEVDRALDAAESAMDSHPDSALKWLEAIDAEPLRGERRARHSLLLSQALNRNAIDLESDSVIAPAVDYYIPGNNLRYKMMTLYYRSFIHMDCREYYDAQSLLFDADKLAEKLGDKPFQARIKLLIARAYLFSFNIEGAREYFEQTLPIVRGLDELDNHNDWMNAVFCNLAHCSMYAKDFARTLEYADSAKKYMPDDIDAFEYELYANIGLDNFLAADSIFDNYLADNNPSVMARCYKLFAEYRLGKAQNVSESLSAMFAEATRADSVNLAGLAAEICFKNKDYYNTWYYTNILLDETNRVLGNMADHSLYRIQLEHNKQEILEKNNDIRNRTQLTIFAGIVVLLLILLGIIYYKFMRKRMAEVQNNWLLASVEYDRLHKEYVAEIEDRKEDSVRHRSEISTMSQQIESSRIAAHELFLTRYAWVEDIGNILLDNESSKSTNRVTRDLKKKMESVKTRQFIRELIDIINNYRNGLLTRVTADCPLITESELNILALLCANLSPRIISFILDIKPQSIYNAKHSIKRKLQVSNPDLLREMDSVFG